MVVVDEGVKGHSSRPSLFAAGGKCTSLSQPLAIDVEQDRGWEADSNGNECQDAVAPAISQYIIHDRSEERESKSCCRSQHSGCPNSRSSVLHVCINQISLNALEASYGTKGEDGSPNVGNNPMRVGLCRPTVEEETDGDEEGAGDHKRNAKLRSAGPVACFEAAIDDIIQRPADLCAEEEPNAERNVVLRSQRGQ